MARHRRTGECIYCAAIGPITDDHVPPKSIFSKADWASLNKVPACAACNSGFSKDDECFRMMLSMRDDVVGVAGAQEALAATMRSLERPQQERLKKATLRNITQAEKFASGIFLGKQPAYRVDLERLAAVVRRIIRGLFWVEFAKPLPANFSVHAIPLDALDAVDLRTRIGLGFMTDASLAGAVRKFGNGVFEYGVNRAIDNADVTVWTLRFYGQVFFTGITAPTDQLSKLTARGRLRP